MKFIILLTITLSALMATATPVSLEKRRFGQQNPPIFDEATKLDKLPGLPGNKVGQFSINAGAWISGLLANTDDCLRFGFLDNMVELSKLTQDPAKGISVAQRMAAAEKNFNPFLASVGRAKPIFCPDANIPKSPELRCIVAVIDESDATLKGAAAFNQKAKERLQDVMSGKLKPEECAGQSVAQQAIKLGFSDCIGCKDTDQVPEDKTPGKDLNQFTGSILGGSPAKVTKLCNNSPFQITLQGVDKGEAKDLNEAFLKACDVQNEECIKLVNSAKGKAVDAKEKLCVDQLKLCKVANNVGTL